MVLPNKYGDEIDKTSFDEYEKTSLEEYLPPNGTELDVALYKSMFKRLRWWRNFRYPFSPKKTWTGQRFSNPKYEEWRQKVIKKHNGKCAKCKLEATHCHHINNFSSNPKLRYELNNGVLLCKECHFKFHWKYGTHNNNKFQLKMFGVTI